MSLTTGVFAQDEGTVMDYSEVERMVAARDAAMAQEAQEKGVSADLGLVAGKIDGTNYIVHSRMDETNTPFFAGSGAKIARPKITFSINPSGGAVAQGLGHRVEIDGNLNVADSVTFTMPDDQVFQGHVVALAIADDNGQVKWLGNIKDCQGIIGNDAATQILYPDVFEGIRADVRLTYSASHFEQDVILRENPRLPEGIDPHTARIEVWTEMFAAPKPMKWGRKNAYRGAIKNGERENISKLQFGLMEIIEGKAFAIHAPVVWTPENHGGALTVEKRWVEQDGRAFLVESVDFAALQSLLSDLPMQTAFLHQEDSLPGISPKRMASTPVKTLSTHELAAVACRENPGVVLDYVLVSCALMNVNFGSLATITGPAAIGHGATDVWNNFNYPGSSDQRISNLRWFDNSSSTVSMRVENAPTAWCNYTGNAMYDAYNYAYGTIRLTIDNLPSGLYDFYLYGHGAADYQNVTFTINEYSKPTGVGAYWNNNQLSNGNFIETNHYVVLRGITVTSGVPVVVLCSPPQGSSLSLINGMQIAGTLDMAPVVNAGADRSNRVSNVSILNGSYSDDGLPVGSSVTVTWSQLSGPGTATFSNIHATNSTVFFNIAGTYVLRLSATDGLLTSSDDMMFTVYPEVGGLETVTRLLNVDMGSGVTKTGMAATGLTASDYWNVYDQPNSTDYTLSNIKWYDNTYSGVNLRVQGAPKTWNNSTGDAMYDAYSYGWQSNMVVTLQNLPEGNWRVFLYGHGAANNQNQSFSINGSTYQSTGAGAYWNNNQIASGGFVFNAHYVVFSNVTITAGNPLAITCPVMSSGYNVFNGFQALKIVTAVINTPPTLSHISDHTMLTNVSSGVVNFTIGDAETPAGNLTVTATSSNTSFLPNNQLILGGSGATRTIMLAEAPSTAGSSVITVSVSDGDYLVSTNFTLNFVAPTIRDSIGYWPLDDTAGAAAMDASGYQHNGTVSGDPSWIAETAVGVGLVFDGLDDAVSVANIANFNLTNTLSLAFWFKQTGTTTNWTRILGKNDTTTHNYVVWMEGPPKRRIMFQAGTAGGTWQGLQSVAYTSTGMWTHVAIAITNLSASLYINGQLNSSTTFTQAFPTTTAPLTMGYCASSIVPFPGILADVRLYNVGLTASEVQTLQSAVYKADFDGDGLSDGWERKYFGDLNQTATGDFNGDGVSNGEAFRAGLSPLTTITRDTDGSITKTKVFSVRPE